MSENFERMILERIEALEDTQETIATLKNHIQALESKDSQQPYRALEVGEIIQKGDEYHEGGDRWVKACSIGHKADTHYRRPNQSKPCAA